MSYVDLKHLLADLALEAVRQPGEVRWPFVTAAYAAFAASAPSRSVPRAEVLRHAVALAGSSGPAPSGEEIDHLIARGLFAQHGSSVALIRRFLPHAAYLMRQAPRLLAALADLRRPGVAAATPEVRTGAALFNAGLFFECHEWFEAVWKQTTGPEKDLYQGIVQAAAAFYHFEKRNAHGSATLIRKARARLARYPSPSAGLDLARFAAGLVQWDAHFSGRGRPAAFPRLEVVPAAGARERDKGAPRG